jgi:hypothetical protein
MVWPLGKVSRSPKVSRLVRALAFLAASESESLLGSG